MLQDLFDMDSNTYFDDQQNPESGPNTFGWKQKDTKPINRSSFDFLYRTKHPTASITIPENIQDNSDFYEPSSYNDLLGESINKIYSLKSASIKNDSQFKKASHNVIERRYRNNINDRIQELKENVPALCKAGKRHDELELVDGIEVAKKLNKATVLMKATEYINSLKAIQNKLDNENMALEHILSCMPNGQQVLTRYLTKKAEYKRTEDERQSRERHEAQERERIERKRVLRQRAAERATLAQIIPRPERKPYRRSRTLLAVAFCFVFFSEAPVKTPILLNHNREEFTL